MFWQKSKIQTVESRKIVFFGFLLSEIPNFSDMGFSENAQCFVGALL